MTCKREVTRKRATYKWVSLYKAKVIMSNVKVNSLFAENIIFAVDHELLDRLISNLIDG